MISKWSPSDCDLKIMSDREATTAKTDSFFANFERKSVRKLTQTS